MRSIDRSKITTNIHPNIVRKTVCIQVWIFLWLIPEVCEIFGIGGGGGVMSNLKKLNWEGNLTNYDIESESELNGGMIIWNAKALRIIKETNGRWNDVIKPVVTNKQLV